MRFATSLVLLGVLLLEACGDGDATSRTSAASTRDPSDNTVVIRTMVSVAPTEHAEPVATGEVIEGSTLEGAPFCVGGKIVDSHANLDPAVEPYGLLARNITCPDGTVKMGFTPGMEEGPTGTGTWTIVSGTGAYDGLAGSGDFEVVYDPDDEALARETYTGTVTP